MREPKLVIPDKVDIAIADERILSNGIKLYTLPCEDFEVFRVSFVFHAGSSMQRVPFSASATANMLAEGSDNMTAQQIAEEFDYYGSYFDVSIDRDYAYISFCSLSKFVPQTLAVAEQILIHPTFADDELTTYCAERKQRLAIERSKVDTQAREAFASAIFGATHPYGIAVAEDAYDLLKREDIVSLYKELYTAKNCFVVCSGRISDDDLDAVASLASKIRQAPHPIVAAFGAPQITHFNFIEHTGAMQSSIRIGRLLFTRTHPDFLGMQVVATILGGYFGSRLMQNLREERGYTYGVVSAMVNFDSEGYLAIATQVGTEVTADALTQIYKEIARLCEEPISHKELSLVKNIMTGEMLRILDGPFGIADVTIENILCGTDNNIIESNIKHIQKIEPNEILRLAQKYLAKKDLVTVVVGAPQIRDCITDIVQPTA